MRTTALVLFMLAVSALAHAQDPPDDPALLQFSWSSTAQQDTLYVAQSGWTNAYLWVRPSPMRIGFVGFWGTVLQSQAVEVHRWRYLGAGAPGDFAFDPQAEQLPIAYLDVPCEDDTGARVVAEFDVWIDMGAMSSGGSRPSSLGLLPEGTTPWEPMLFYRKDPADPCGYLSTGYAAVSNSIVALDAALPVHAATFGSLKALYR